jgi:quinol-cytochrome oxidoreductase complex cytochrome b subunit
MSDQGPNVLHEVFSQKTLVLTLFGALGGSVRAAVLKTGWKESLRVIFVGGAVSFGVGVAGPGIILPFFGDLGDSNSMGVLTSSAFLLGLISCTIVERVFTNIWGAKDHEK